jgi:hypothetical protein
MRSCAGQASWGPANASAQGATAPKKAGHSVGRRAGLVLAALLLSSCSPSVDLKQALQVTVVSTGWYDFGVVDGKNKLVPSVTFTLKRPPDVKLSSAALNIVFRKDTGEEHDDVFVQRLDFGEDGATQPITVRGTTGYTGDPPQSRADMLKNSQFRDMDAEIFARQSSSQWVSLHKVRVVRELITH